MIEDANRQLEGEGASEAGAFFGAREAENTRLSRSYTMRGLGNKGLENLKEANEDLKRAVDLSYSNLWATTELNEL